MYNICVFAGTSEGRRLVSFLASQPVRATVCVATEYGKSLLQNADNLTVSCQRLSEPEMIAFFAEQQFDLVIDATHPYAETVSNNAASACAAQNIKYIRLVRKNSLVPTDAVFVSSVEEAVSFLDRSSGTVFLATGSKELMKYCSIRDFSSRIYARILPDEASFEMCRKAGLPSSHIIAVQGPFSEEMNTAMLKAVSAQYFVTKDGGETGGFEKKAAAAQKAGAVLVVIGRPREETGISFSTAIRLLCEQYGCEYRPNVTVVGIGPGSRNAMTQEVYQAVKNADCLIGSRRLIEKYASAEQAVLKAIAPNDIAAYIRSECEYQNFVVLMSGDSGFYSGTRKLLPLLAEYQPVVLPGLSSLAVLCAKLHLSYEEIAVVSLHGRNYNPIREIRSCRHTFLLTGGTDDIVRLCRFLINAELDDVTLTVGERLSDPEERITTGTAEMIMLGQYDSVSTVLIENPHPDLIVTPGLPEELFYRTTGSDEHVPMTKSEVRAVCISKLRLNEYAVCWDVGSGTGSVAVEMAMQVRKGRVYAI